LVRESSGYRDPTRAITGRKILLWIAATALVLAQAGLALAAPTQAIYGPFSVKLPNTKLFSTSGGFNAPASVTGPYLLRVQLSAPNSLTSLSFKLNNNQVLSLSDFSGGVTQVDRPATVLPSNSYSLQIAGKANTVITVTVFATPNLVKPTSLAPDPLAVTVGSGGTLTAALSPTPSAAGTLSVVSSNTGVASVPASVTFASGQTSVTIPVTAVAPGTSVVTASTAGGNASATVNVTPAPPTVSSLLPPSIAVTQGASGNFTVTISATRAADTPVPVVSSNPGIASVPAMVTVPAGQLSAPVPVSGVSPGTAQITASLNGSSASSQVTVNPAPPTVVSLLPATSTVTVGASATLTLTISAAQAAATPVALTTSPPGIVSVPQQVIVPAGQTTAAVSVGTLALGQGGVTATLNGTTASAIVNVAAPPIAVTVLEPATFTLNVGATGTFTVRINAAQASDTPIALSVDNAQALQIPPSVTVALGTTSALFTATGLAPGNAIITASANATSKSSSVHVSPQPAAIASLLPNPLPLQEGATGSLTASINVAQETDTTVALASDTPSVATVPGSVTVAAGALTALIPVSALAGGTANITASVNGASTTSAVTVTGPPPDVTSITPDTLNLPKGTPGTLRVTVSHAPSLPTAVSLSSNNPTVASVPASVNIPAGALFADFPVASNGEGLATITATLGETSASATVNIAPAEIAAINITPQNPTMYTTDNALLFRATGVLTDGRTNDLTRILGWVSSDTSIASIGFFNGFTFPLRAGTTTISMSFTYTTALDGSLKTVTGTSLLTVKTPVTLALTAPTTTLVEGIATTVTIFSNDPAPANGLVVSVFANGAGSGTFPAAVTIPAGGTSADFSLTPGTQGDLTLTAFAPQRNPGAITFTILPALRITAISPPSGPLGTVVGLTGVSFDPVPANNHVSFPGANGTSVPATVLTASPTLITFAVPAAAASGPITVSNSRGTATSAPFTITGPGTLPLVSLSVATPANGASVGSDKVTVSGAVQGPLNTGVTVNGITAAVTGNTFVAGAVPLQPGANTLTVTAISVDGQTLTRSVSVTSTGPAPIQVTADTVQGLAPLNVNFTVTNTSGKTLTSVQVDFTGSGNFSFFSAGSPVSNNYTVPGTYQAQFFVFDNSGASVQQTITIVVEDPVQVDQILQATWIGFMSALASGNATQATGFFNTVAQLRYQPVFEGLAPSLPQIALSFSPLQLMVVSNGVGEYAINRTIDGVDRVFLLYFLQDTDGVWRLDSM